MTTVVNLYKEPFDVYVGRPGKGQSGYFGNPFNDGTREENISRFKFYFHERLRKDMEFKARVMSLKGKALGCFCKPKPCHGNVIADYLNSISPIKLAIVGSRTFNDYALLKSSVSCFEISLIISGGAKGADALARRYAEEHNIPIKEHIPDWTKHGKAAGFIRNKLIIGECDEVIAFWDGQSKGTQHDINLAQEAGKPVCVVRFSNNDVLEDEISKLGI